MTEHHALDPDDALAQGHSLRQWSDAIAESTPAPGGGAAVAIAASLAASVLVMCLGLTLGRRRFSSVEEEFAILLDEADDIRENLILLAEEDVIAYGSVAEARGLPKASKDEAMLRRLNLNTALLGASDVQLAILRLCRELAAAALRVFQAGNPSVRADASAAMFLASGAARAAQFNVLTNLAAIQDPPEALATGTESSESRIQETIAEVSKLIADLEGEERGLDAGPTPGEATPEQGRGQGGRGRGQP